MKKALLAAFLALAASIAHADGNTPAGHRYVVQIGTFDEPETAQHWVDKLNANGVRAYTENRTQADGSTRTLLRAGPFPDREHAAAALDEVRALGLGGVASAPNNPVADAPPAAVPAKKTWWVVASSRTHCMTTGGPADKIESFIGGEEKPQVQDFHDSHGDVIKVEVSESAGEFDTRVWTYYREKDACESEQVNGLKSLAEKYR